MERGVARGHRAAAQRNRIVKRAHQGIRRTDGENRRESYPQVALIKQVKGVGTQIALTYVLTLEDPQRFPKSRDVGCFLGLRPGRRDSGESQPQMHISKEGDPYLRTMLKAACFFCCLPRYGS
ncbi:MAG: hypothetical protein DMG54_28150 [Acidobacteria bacterium]|nr:MAG: hypothetical protein DMG54_28150 [Acidobacteriota bacterium]PYU71221.1 MAG: hypothetical protein DMG52_22965 [Acidobacteriota bacterium]